MTDLSEKTRAEMAAGAQHLANIAGQGNLPPGYMEAVFRTHERAALIRRWESAGKLTIEATKRLSVKLEDRATHDWHQMYHVLPGKSGPTFTDIDAERLGASPSEVLVANIALALQAAGEL